MLESRKSSIMAAALDTTRDTSMDFLPWSFSDVDFNQPAMNKARARLPDLPGTIQECLQEFLNAVCDDQSFRAYLDPNFLMRFLGIGRFNIDVAHKRLKHYYSIRRKHPEIFQDFLPSNTLRAQSLNHISLMPYRDRANSLVLLLRLGLFDPSVASFEEFIRLTLLVAELLLQNPVTILSGIVLILDFTGFSILQFSQLTPSRIQTMFDVFDNSGSFRVVCTHVINAPSLVKGLFELLKISVITPEMQETFFSHVLGQWETLHSHIPPQILPEEFMGHLKPSQMVDVFDLINYNEDFFLEQLQCG